MRGYDLVALCAAGSGHAGGTLSIMDITAALHRAGTQEVIIGVDAPVDRSDPLDQLGLERRRHDEPSFARHPRTAPASGGSVNRPASEPPSTCRTAPEMCPAAGEQRKSTAFATS